MNNIITALLNGFQRCVTIFIMKFKFDSYSKRENWCQNKIFYE